MASVTEPDSNAANDSDPASITVQSVDLSVLKSPLLGVLAVVVFLGNRPPAPEEGVVRLLQVTDTHLYANPDGRLLGQNTRETLDDYFEFVDDLERKDWFVQYLNTIVEEFDPHTYYFAPEDKERFDMSMSGKFEGIGARLQKRSEGAKIVEIISGGPVWRDQRLEVGGLQQDTGQRNQRHQRRDDAQYDLAKGFHDLHVHPFLFEPI